MTRARQDDDNSKPESRLLDRRKWLLCGTTLSAACLLCTLGTTSLAQQTTGTPGSPGATTTIDGKYLPPPPPKFGGDINLQASQSKPYWPARVVPPKGAPNVLLIMKDGTVVELRNVVGTISKAATRPSTAPASQENR